MSSLPSVPILRGKPQFTYKPRPRRQFIGKYNTETGQWDGQTRPPYGYPWYVFLIIVFLLIGTFLLVVLLPTLEGKSSERREMTLESTTTLTTVTSPTTTTEAASSTTTAAATGGPPSTTPAVVPLLLQCPPTARVFLGKDWLDTNVTGTPTVVGGCTDPQITFEDTITGTVSRAEKKALTPNHRYSPFKRPKTETVSGHTIQVEAVHLHVENPLMPEKRQPHLRRQAEVRGPSFPQSKLSFPNVDDVEQSDASPPDATVEVGATQVLHVLNVGNGTQASGSQLTIFDKALNRLSQFVIADQLGSATPSSACQQGGGEAEVLFDHVAGRWLVLEKASVNDTLCLYVSITASASSTATNWMFYEIPIADFSFPARLAPQLGLFNDYYLLSLNIDGAGPPPMLFIERQPILSQAATTRVLVTQSFPSLIGFTFQHMSPVNLENGSPQPSFPGAIFVRLNDDELHGGTPHPSEDYIDVVQFLIVNFDTETAVFQFYQVAIAEVDSSTVGCTAVDACVLTPSGLRINANQNVLGKRVQFRRLNECPGEPERMVLSLTTAAGSAQSKVRWIELEYNSGLSQFRVRQEANVDFGDSVSRFLPSISMDRYGNMVLTYAAASSSLIPSMRATSRVQTDPLNQLREEIEWATGLPDPGPATDSAWGNTFNVAADGDPIEGRTFYATGQYSVRPEEFNVRVARLRQGADYLERRWVAEDPLCQQIQQCLQTIQLG